MSILVNIAKAQQLNNILSIPSTDSSLKLKFIKY